VLLVVGFGLVFTFVIPPLGGFDEPLHFLRAWQVSDGVVLPTPRPISGGRTDLFVRVPKSLPPAMRAVLIDGVLSSHDAQGVWKHLGDRDPRGSRTWIGIEAAGAYSPVPYLPAAVAIRVGRVLGLSTLALVELARIAQVLAYGLLVGLAVRRVESRALVLAVVALAPVALIQAGTVSADPVTIGLALLVVAEAAALLSRPPDAIGWPLLLEVGAAVVALALAKPPYILVAALLVAPAWRHRGRIAAALGGAIVPALGLGIAWNKWAQAHYVAPENLGGLGSTYAYHDVAPTRQTHFVEHHPWGFVETIGRTLAHGASPIIRDTLAQSPSWQSSRVLVVATLAVVAAALALSPRPFAGGRWVRALGAAIAAALFALVFFLAYAGWNAVAAPRIDAVQGRYLLPVFAVLAIVVAPGVGVDLDVDRPRLTIAVLAGSAAVAVAVAVGIARFVFL
jgi:uncharacterized membrane protein